MTLPDRSTLGKYALAALVGALGSLGLSLGLIDAHPDCPPCPGEEVTP